MCGIAGTIGLTESTREYRQALLEKMTSALAYRGPDGQGVWHDDMRPVSFGHRRLAIIDLSTTGCQPMVSSNKRFAITYNGEIYNAHSLRKELEYLGSMFRGTSDTEVILESCAQWGVLPTINRLAGMFAFAIWDRADHSLFLVRDRIGEKPVYYGWIGNDFCFASELKALRQHPAWGGVIDREALELYTRFSYVPAPHSIYEGISKLPPASVLKFDESHRLWRSIPTPLPYWSLKTVLEEGSRQQFAGDLPAAADALQSLLRTIVTEQMSSDVPLGALLSGGIDSSVIVALMQEISPTPIRTFTMASDDRSYDESNHATAVATHLGTNHTTLLVSAREAIALIPTLPIMYDEPFADSSQIPTALIARLARQHVKVCLTGDGGDEVFAGYNRHVELDKLWRIIGSLPRWLRSRLGSLLVGTPVRHYEWALKLTRRNLLGDQVQKIAALLKATSVEEAYRTLATHWEGNSVAARPLGAHSHFFDENADWPQLPTVLERLLWLESVTSLPGDMMTKIDRATMAVGLEARVPLVDFRVVEFAACLPLTFKFDGRRGKRVLRDVLTRYVPAHLSERPKQGFSVPLDSWMRGPLREWCECMLDPARLRAEGFFNEEVVQKHWIDHLSGNHKWQGRLWNILMFQAWLENERAAA